MELESPIGDALYDSIPHSTARQHRVDPRYPLHNQPGREGFVNGQTVPIDDATRRTTSRRRKPSGSGGAGVAVAMPAALDVPKSSRGGPPVSYRDPYGAEIAPPPDTSTKSFSARAAAQPNAFDTSFAAYNASEPLPGPEEREEERKQSRRISTGHAAPVTFPTVQKPPEPLYTEDMDPTPSKRMGQVTRSNPRVSNREGTADDRGSRQDMAPPKRSNTVRSSAGGQSDWASDRSPLQRLEVQLSDISKEEKRARVMQAEARLRDSKVSDRRASSGFDPIVNRTSSKRVVSEEDPRRRSSRANEHLPETVIPAQRGYNPNSIGRNSSIREPQFQGRRGSQQEKFQKAPPPEVADRLGYTSPKKPADLGRSDSRAVRFQNQGTNKGPIEQDQEPNSIERRRYRDPKVSLANDRLASNKNDKRHNFGEQDPIPREAVRSEGHGPRNKIPPQTAAGVEARQRIGFGDRIDDPADPIAQRSHHLSDLIHGRHAQPQSSTVPPAQNRHLDEWRQGGTAHLSLTDANAPIVEKSKMDPDQAWWESPVPLSKRRHSSAPVEVTAFDGAQEDSTGKISPLPHDRRASLSSFLQHPGRKWHHSDRGDQPGYPYIHRGNRVWYGFRHSGHPRSLAGSLSSGTTSFSSVKSSSTTDSPTPLPYAPFGHFLSHLRQPFLNHKLTRRSSELSVPEEFSPQLYLRCGPLLRYTGLKRERPDQPNHRGRSSGRETWRGSVMIVTDDTQSVYKPVPTLRLFHEPMSLLPPPPQQYDGSKEEELQSEYVDPVAGLPKMTRSGGTVWVKPAEDLEVGKDVSLVENDDGLYEATRTANVPSSYGKADEFLGRHPSAISTKGKQDSLPKVGRFRQVKGIRLHTERGATFWRFNIEVELGDKETRIAYRINQGKSTGFWVPAKGQTMNIMFHSCNGFSKSVDSNAFSGPDPLWRDVLNAHQLKPFHVMIGGGDQIYNDKVMDETEHFSAWLEIKNPHHKHEAEFSPIMQDELELFYLERYCMWFSQGLFGMANSQIPMINIWDDHDIIDGFGSYPDHFMSSKVFSGLGSVAFKYYMLFQHQSVVNETEADEPSWLLGSSPGPYINELNRSVFMSLGGRCAFLGIDCRTERTVRPVSRAIDYLLTISA